MEQWLKEKIGRISADYAEIRLEERKSVSIALAGKEVDSISEPVTVGGGVRILLDGGWSYCSFNDFSQLDQTIEKALRNARWASGVKRAVKSVKPYRAINTTEVKISPATISLDEKRTLLEKYNKIMLETKGITSTRSRYHDRIENRWFANSEGTYIENRLVFTGMMCAAIAAEGSNIQQNYLTLGGYKGFESLQGLEGKVSEIPKIAIDLLKAEPVKGGKYQVLLDPQLAGVFTHEAFGHLSEADFLFENPQMIEMMKIGRKMGPEFLSIVDDGTVPGEAGFLFSDDEGVPAKKNDLIRNGILAGHLHNRETAEKMGEDLTGNGRAISYQFEPIVRMTNTYIENGKSSLDEMMGSVKDGIYALNCIGGQTSLEMFTFSALYGYEIKNGKPGKMLKDIVLTGNVFETLPAIRMIGNDLSLHGGLGGCGKEGQSPLPVSDGSPHLLIDNVVIGGES